jgi:transcriptional regulator with XRE-family HTH domain
MNETDGALSPGDQLRAWRAGRRIKQGDLAADLGVSQSHLARIESGERRPGADLADQIRRRARVRFPPLETSGRPVEPRTVPGEREPR